MFDNPRYLILPLLVLLAACSQVPTPDNGASADLGTLAFGSPASEVATGLAKHRTGVYVVGHTTGTLDGPRAGLTDGIIRKYSASGTKLWGRQFGTSRNDMPSAVASDANDNVYVVGDVADTEEGATFNSDAFIRKYSPSGSVLWHRKFGPSTSEETATGVAVSGSHVYVVGDTNGALAGSKGGGDVFIRKYSASGTVVWTRQFGTSGYDSAYDVAVDASGNTYVVGRVAEERSSYGSDMYIRKYSPTGSLLWTRQQRGLAYDTGDAVAVFGNHVYLVGMSQEPYAVHAFKYTTSGTLVWSRVRRPYYEEVNDANTDPNGNLYIAGRTRIETTEDDDGYVRKMSASGSTLWTRQMSSPTGDYTYAVAAPTNDKVYAAGFTFGTLDGSTGRNADAFLRRLNASNGSTVWTDQ